MPTIIILQEEVTRIAREAKGFFDIFLNLELNKYKLEQHFQRMDRDNDGFVDVPELRLFYFVQQDTQNFYW